MSYFNQAIETLQNWLKIKSVKEPSLLGMPFGKGIADMLDLALKNGEELGFKSYNYDNYIGEIVWGEGDDKLGFAILCHLDVVPAVGNWSNDPFTPTISDGKLYVFLP